MREPRLALVEAGEEGEGEGREGFEEEQAEGVDSRERRG